MRDESNRFQLTVCMTARGVIYARRTESSGRSKFRFRLIERFCDHLRNLLTKAGNRLSNPGAVGGIGLGAIGDVPLLNVFGRCADLSRRVVEQRLALSGVHLAEEIARLLIVVIIDSIVPVGGRAVDRQRWLVELRPVGPLTPAIGKVARRSSKIAVGAHRPVAVIAVERTLWRVDGDVVKVDPETIALGIAIRKEPSLQH